MVVVVLLLPLLPTNLVYIGQISFFFVLIDYVQFELCVCARWSVGVSVYVWEASSQFISHGILVRVSEYLKAHG